MSSPSPTVCHPQSPNTFTDIMTEYPTVLQPHFHSQTVDHGITHHIQTSGPPISARTRRLQGSQKLFVFGKANICGKGSCK